METDKISFCKAANRFLESYYENNGDTPAYSMYRFMHDLVSEARLMAKSVSLSDMDYQDSMVATWFYYVGFTIEQASTTPIRTALLQDYFALVNYPFEHRSIVLEAIHHISDGKKATNKVQQVISDAIYSWFSQPNFIENIILLKEEENRLNGENNTELSYLQFYLQLFITARYYSQYAMANYTAAREKNFQLLEKRIRKTETQRQTVDRNIVKMADPVMLTDKETEDLFKLAFRNYNHLISVADSKASLLINVNSIIISVMLAFVLSKVEKNSALLLPTTLLLVVSAATIFISILASRPQKNIFSEDEKAHNYQRFFFGSFDLIDPSFRHAGWDNYLSQLNELFSSSREIVYLELYKETYNVRKVLSKKFSYLSIAYWVFIIGLLLSISAFIIVIKSQTMV